MTMDSAIVEGVLKETDTEAPRSGTDIPKISALLAKPLKHAVALTVRPTMSHSDRRGVSWRHEPSISLRTMTPKREGEVGKAFALKRLDTPVRASTQYPLV